MPTAIQVTVPLESDLFWSAFTTRRISALVVLLAPVAAFAMTSPHHPVAPRAAPSGCTYTCPDRDNGPYPLIPGGNEFPNCYYSFYGNANTPEYLAYTAKDYSCTYGPQSGALTGHSAPQPDCPEMAQLACGMRKRGRRAGDPKTKLEQLMSRRPAKTVERTKEMEAKRKVMGAKGTRTVRGTA